ncbi:MAG TPA: hypothetical protein VGP63_18640 [Planctomycetaceae bacterium]|jgi:hypothetical protein|nr:hypothetical protein [Planctomycetaceae bacterium]
MPLPARQSCLSVRRSGRHSFVFAGAAILLGICLPPSAQADEEKAIAAVETYGSHRVSRQSVLDAAGLPEGAAAPDRTQRKAILDRLQKIPGVRRAAIVVVVTPFPNSSGGTIGRPIVYIGIQESDRPDASFRAAPTGNVALPEAVVATYAEHERTFLESCKTNHFSEDDSHGYALMGNAAARAVQRKFVPLADQHYDRLVDVLRNSKNAEQRSAAATVMGYASDKKRAARDLIFGTRDANDGVRNDAVRALSVLLTYAREHRELGIEVSADWCLDLLESLQWTDRNKAMAVLDAATADRDAELLVKLRQRSLPSLIEMARWKSSGHAMMALLLVGRIAGLKDAEIWKAQDASEREKVIARVLRSQPAEQNTMPR